MRAFLTIILSTLIFGAFSQNFVSPGIIAYHSGAYERTIQDMNKAFQTTRGMDSETRGKAYYYRGMARLNLLKAGSNSAEIGNNPYQTVYDDLDRAVLLDPKWNESVNTEKSFIYNQLLTAANQSYNLGYNAATETEVRNYFGAAILKSTTAAKINDSYEANALLGKSYLALGDFYDQYIDDESLQKRAISSYESAKEFYEKALGMNARSLESIKALKYIAYRFGDRDKEVYYAQLEASIRG